MPFCYKAKKKKTLFVLFYSVLGCVFPLQEVAFHYASPAFPVPCYPCSYHSLLLQNVISPSTCWSSNWSYVFYLPFSASNGPFTAVHSGDVPSPFQFHFCDALKCLALWDIFCFVFVLFFFSLMMVFLILSFNLKSCIFFPFCSLDGFKLLY